MIGMSGGRSPDPLIEAWLTWMASGFTAESTIRQRRYILGAFAREYPLVDATGADVEEYVGRSRRGPEARKSVLATLRSFYRWALARGLVDHDPTLLARSIHVPAGVPKPVPEAVLARALAKADEATRLMLTLGAYAGLRLSEIAAVNSRDVSETGLRVLGKGAKVRRVPVHPLLAPQLEFTGWAFPSPLDPDHHVSRDYVSSRVEAVLSGHTTHSLRHRFATSAYRATKDLRAVQMLLGHTSPTTTALYVLVDEDSLVAAVNAVA
jgi:site-specific recombinase XerD